MLLNAAMDCCKLPSGPAWGCVPRGLPRLSFSTANLNFKDILGVPGNRRLGILWGFEEHPRALKNPNLSSDLSARPWRWRRTALPQACMNSAVPSSVIIIAVRSFWHPAPDSWLRPSRHCGLMLLRGLYPRCCPACLGIVGSEWGFRVSTVSTE
jgi:hypothetical protein